MELDQDWQQMARVLSDGGIAVVPTDTLYGLVGSARQPAVVERIFKLRGRNMDKPPITLVADIDQIEQLIGRLDERTRALAERVWPGPVSLIFACNRPELAYLHRGSGGISFRMPAKPALRELLLQAGPLVAPSANPQDLEPAHTVDEARAYFDGMVDGYIDEGPLQAAPSALVDVRGAKPKVLRTAPGFNVSSVA